MPIYEYVCGACKHEFERLVRSMTGHEDLQCPACQSNDVARKLSVFAARQGQSKTSCEPSPAACAQCCNPDRSCPL
ncbi:MAG: zinc ribbon domain-containing protein [Phycisphaerales bacterium]|nr:MAG: zinc ribbon domain-containing protein [Phycisphaerales bacterium]